MLSLEDDDRLLLKEDSTLTAAGIGEEECVCHVELEGALAFLACMVTPADCIWIT